MFQSETVGKKEFDSFAVKIHLSKLFYCIDKKIICLQFHSHDFLFKFDTTKIDLYNNNLLINMHRFKKFHCKNVLELLLNFYRFFAIAFNPKIFLLKHEIPGRNWVTRIIHHVT